MNKISIFIIPCTLFSTTKIEKSVLHKYSILSCFVLSILKKRYCLLKYFAYFEYLNGTNKILIISILWLKGMSIIIQKFFYMIKCVK